MNPTPQQLVSDALENGGKLLPDAILPLADTFCGCGAPASAWRWVLEYLLAQNEKGYRPREGAELLGAYVLDHCGLTEHGAVIDGAWLTDAGREVLAFLQENGADWAEQGWWVGSDGATRAYQ